MKSTKSKQQLIKAAKKADFSRSFKPKVRLPNDGRPCTLQRHYGEALKLIVARFDYLATIDEGSERFVYAKLGDFQKKCLHPETRKQYSRRTIERCFEYLTEKGVIQPAEPRDRRGAVQTGVIVAEHSALFEVIGRYCIFCGQEMPMSQPMSQKSSQDVASDVASDVALNHPQNKDGIEDEPNHASNSASGSASDCASLVLEKSKKDEKQAKHLFKTPNLTIARAMPFTSDTSLETILNRITDGEFEIGALMKYENVAELKDACLRSIHFYSRENFRSRLDCLKILVRVMKEMEDAKVRWPRNLLKMKTILSQNRPLHILPDKIDAFASGEVLGTFQSLAAYADIVNAAAGEFGLPNGWAEAATFLTKVITRLEDNFISVPGALPEALAYFKSRVDEASTKAYQGENHAVETSW